MCAHVCPWWGGWLIDNPLRRWLHNPETILGSYVRPGMTVMDVGCGMGIFSIAMARMVGEAGRVISVDLQQEMLETVGRRAMRAGVADRIELCRAEPDRLGAEATVDFALAFAMVHEAPDTRALLGEIADCLKPGSRLLVAEPKLHVPRKQFARMLEIAASLGLELRQQPKICCCHAAVLEKP